MTEESSTKEEETVDENDYLSYITASRTISGLQQNDIKQITDLQSDEDCLIKDCTGGSLYITTVVGAVYLKNLKDCKVFLGPVKGSILMYNCENCIFVLASRQVMNTISSLISIDSDTLCNQL